MAKALARLDTELPQKERLVRSGLERRDRRAHPLVAALLLRSAWQLQVAYTADASIDRMRELLASAAERWQGTYELAGDQIDEPAFDRYAGPAALVGGTQLYASAVDLVAWAVALGDRDALARLAALPVVARVHDRMLDSLLTMGGIDREVSPTVLHPSIADGWLRIVDAPPDARSSALVEHVRGWEASMRRAGLAEAPDAHDFTGRWCVAVVPLVLAWRLDDAQVRDVHAYPDALVDAVRGR